MLSIIDGSGSGGGSVPVRGGVRERPAECNHPCGNLVCCGGVAYGFGIPGGSLIVKWVMSANNIPANNDASECGGVAYSSWGAFCSPPNLPPGNGVLVGLYSVSSDILDVRTVGNSTVDADCNLVRDGSGSINLPP